MRRVSTFGVISRLLGLLLIAAGLLKGFEEAAQIVAAGGGNFTHRAWQGVIPAAEIAFGLWLLIALAPKISWWLLMACFIAFLGANLDKAISGEETCGCFGRFDMNPWLMFSFDLAVVLVLPFALPTESSPSALNKSKLAAFLAANLAVCGGLFATAWLTQSSLGEDGELLGSGTEVRLQPADWIGKRFPLQRHIDIGADLSRGKWSLMFYHADCPGCRIAVADFVAAAAQVASSAGSRAALIEVSGNEKPSEAGSTRQVLRATMAPGREWIISVPNFVRLQDGIVLSQTQNVQTAVQALVPSEKDQDVGAYLFPDYAAIRREMFLKEIACGPLALIKILEELRIPLDENKAEALLDEAGDKGIDLLRLKELAEENGLHALGVECSVEALRKLNLKAVVQLEKIGFAAVIGYRPEGIVTVYPLRAPGILPDDVFEKAFGKNGKALLISRSPLRADRLGVARTEANTQGPPLTVRPSQLAVGRIHRKDWEASVTLSNEGNEPVLIDEITTVPPGISVVPESATIAPGMQIQVRAKGRHFQLGGFTNQVQLSTKKGQHAFPITIPVWGYIEAPIGFAQPTVRVTGLGAGQASSVCMPFSLPKSIPFDKLRLEVPKRSPLTAYLKNQEGGPQVEVQWSGSLECKWHNYEIKVFSEPGQYAVPAILPCAFEVIHEPSLKRS
jgi:methylamine utilization protein MauE/peptidase C39-like protein